MTATPPPPSSTPPSASPTTPPAPPSTGHQPAASDHHAFPAWRSRLAWLVLVSVSLFGAGIDLWSKDWAFRVVAQQPVVIDRADVLTLSPGRLDSLIPFHEPMPVLKSLLEFRLVLNPGAVFGMGAGKRWFFVLFTGAALLFAVYMFAAWTSRRDHAAHTAIGLIIAGGIGNLYDRVVFGCVRDFLSFLPGVDLPWGLSWPGGDIRAWPWVSNIADAFLLIGVGILVIHTLRPRPLPSRSP